MLNCISPILYHGEIYLETYVRYSGAIIMILMLKLNLNKKYAYVSTLTISL